MEEESTGELTGQQEISGVLAEMVITMLKLRAIVEQGKLKEDITLGGIRGLTFARLNRQRKKSFPGHDNEKMH